MYDLILRDATIVSSTGRLVADIAIQDGVIKYVGPRPRRDAKQDLSAIGKFIMPGVIDTAVDFGSADWQTESRAAVSGGVTTVVVLPGGRTPVVDGASARARVKAARGTSWCNYMLWLDGDSASPAEATSAITSGDAIGALLTLGDDDDLTDRLATFMDLPGVLGVALSRTPRDADGVNQVLSAAREHNRHIHILHLSTADELTALDPVLGELPVTASVTAHHLFLNTEPDEDAPVATTRPPIRPDQDRRTLWTALKRNRILCVASDHHSARQSGPGTPGVEFMFPLLVSAVRHGRLSLEQLVAITSEGPAELLGLPNKGRIEKGADADLVLFSEGELARVRQRHVMTGSEWSPYVGREAAPKPDLVIVNGQIVSKRGTLQAASANGVHLSAQPSVAG